MVKLVRLGINNNTCSNIEQVIISRFNWSNLLSCNSKLHKEFIRAVIIKRQQNKFSNFSEIF